MSSTTRLKRMVISNLYIAVLAIVISNHAHSEVPSNIGIGPITELKLEDLSLDLAKKGRTTFAAKCAACHKVGERYVGPELGGVFKRRNPAWIMNMILNPVEMTQKDPTAQELLAEFLVQMTFQNVSKDEARSILEYFRYYADKGEIAEEKAENKTKGKATKKTKKQ